MSLFHTGVPRRPRTAVVAALLGLCLAAACDENPNSPSGDSSGTVAGAPAPAGATLQATRYLAFGDSMTEGEITAPTGGAATLQPFSVVPTASFPAQLEVRLRARYPGQAGGIAVTNAGRSAELAENALPRLQQLLANSQTQALLLLDGANDLLDFGAGGVSPAAAAMNLLAREGRQRGARVFIGLLPPGVSGRQRSVEDGVIRAFNDQLRAIAAGEGAVVVDLYTALSDTGRFIGVDGHHPNEAGYQRIADAFLAAVVAEFERR